MICLIYSEASHRNTLATYKNAVMLNNHTDGFKSAPRVRNGFPTTGDSRYPLFQNNIQSPTPTVGLPEITSKM